MDDRAKAILLRELRKHIRMSGGKAVRLHRHLRVDLLRTKKLSGRYSPDVVKRMKEINDFLKILAGLDKAIGKALGGR